MKNKLVVWHNLNKNTFYVKAVRGYYCNYHIGYVNQYNHKIVYIYELNNYSSREKKSILDLAISPIILLLRFIIRLLEKLTSYI